MKDFLLLLRILSSFPDKARSLHVFRNSRVSHSYQLYALSNPTWPSPFQSLSNFYANTRIGKICPSSGGSPSQRNTVERSTHEDNSGIYPIRIPTISTNYWRLGEKRASKLLQVLVRHFVFLYTIRETIFRLRLRGNGIHFYLSEFSISTNFTSSILLFDNNFISRLEEISQYDLDITRFICLSENIAPCRPHKISSSKQNNFMSLKASHVHSLPARREASSPQAHDDTIHQGKTNIS